MFDFLPEFFRINLIFCLHSVSPKNPEKENVQKVNEEIKKREETEINIFFGKVRQISLFLSKTDEKIKKAF